MSTVKQELRQLRADFPSMSQRGLAHKAITHRKYNPVFMRTETAYPALSVRTYASVYGLIRRFDKSRQKPSQLAMAGSR